MSFQKLFFLEGGHLFGGLFLNSISHPVFRLLLLSSLSTLVLTSGARAKVTLERSWVRSTLSSRHVGFRHNHKMAPVLTDRLVIQGNGTDSIGAYSRRTGRLKWQRAFTDGVEGGAAIDGETLFFGAGDGFFYALEVATGKTLWKQPISSEALASPTVQGGYVFFLAGNNSLFSFDKNTGRPVWVKTRPLKATMTLRGVTQPTYSNGAIFVGYSDGWFAAFEASSGRQLWNQRIGDGRKFNDVDASARVAGSCLLTSSFANALYCLNPKDGRTVWKHDHGAFQPVTVFENKVYLPTREGEIHILDLASGKLLKKILVGATGLSSEIIFSKGFMIYGESKGDLVLRDAQSLEVLDRFRPGRGIFARPTIDEASQEIYIVSNQGNLFEVKLLEKGEDFPWRSKTHF